SQLSPKGGHRMNLHANAALSLNARRRLVDGGCWTLLDNRASRWLGSRSYSFYLVHVLVLYEVGGAIAELGDGYKVTLVWLFPVALAVTALAAEVLYRAVERPFRRGKRRVV